MEDIVRAHRGEPSQFVDAKPEQGVRPERARLDRQPHGDRRGVPARSRETLKQRALCGRLVEVVGLGIEFGREPLDVFARDSLFRALEAHAEDQIIEPFDHRPLPDCTDMALNKYVFTRVRTWPAKWAQVTAERSVGSRFSPVSLSASVAKSANGELPNGSTAPT